MKSQPEQTRRSKKGGSADASYCTSFDSVDQAESFFRERAKPARMIKTPEKQG